MGDKIPAARFKLAYERIRNHQSTVAAESLALGVTSRTFSARCRKMGLPPLKRGRKFSGLCSP